MPKSGESGTVVCTVPLVTVEPLFFSGSNMPKRKSSAKQPDPAMTQKVIRCLEQLATKSTTTWRQGANGMRRLGPKAMPSLIAILTGRDPHGRDDDRLRIQVASYLYMVKAADRAAAKALIAALKDPSPTVRSMSSQALSRVAPAAGVEMPDSAIANVVAALANCPLGARYGSAMAVNEMACVVKSRAAAAVPSLIETLAARDWEVRCAALASLRHIGPPAAPAVAHFLRLLKEDPHKEVRRSAALGLAEIGARPVRAVAALRRALKDKDAMVRHAAAEALGGYEQATRL
jgi:HEAT repeat protein